MNSNRKLESKMLISTYRMEDDHNTEVLNSVLISNEWSEKREFNIGKFHRSYHLFLYIQEGELDVMLDSRRIRIKGPAIHYVLPRQICCALYAKGVKGWCLAIESSVIDKQMSYFLDVKTSNLDTVTPGNSISHYLDDCFQLLHNIYSCGLSSLNIQKYLANSSIEIIATTYRENEAANFSGNKRSGKHAQEFFSLLKSENIRLKSPSEYASIMNISPSYLNECIRSDTGKPVSYWIYKEIILEAQQLLQYSNLSVKKIACKLGFEDHAYFSRLFSKHVQMTAREFRQKHMIVIDTVLNVC